MPPISLKESSSKAKQGLCSTFPVGATLLCFSINNNTLLFVKIQDFV